MKKEYTASIRKARNAASKATVEDNVVAKGKKRKLSDVKPDPKTAAGKKTKITISVGDVEVSIDHDSAVASGKATKSKAVSSSAATTSSLAKSKALQASASTRKPPMAPRATKTPKSQNNVQTPSVSVFESREVPSQAVGLPPTIATPQRARIKAEPKVKKEPTSDHRSPSKTTPKIKTEVKPEVNSADSPSRRYITGVYNVTSAKLSSQYAHEANNLRLFLCVDNESNKIWGGFELVSKSGVLCITDYTNVDAPLSFGWRARDLHRGGLSFGRGCFGDIQFFDDRHFTATVFNMFPEPVELRGERRPGPLWCGKSA